MEQLFALLDKLAGCDSMVLIRGESGTGKELVAEAIHRHSTRRQRPLVKVNCGALVETLLLSELFGHERGAFTGAVARHRGRFEIADGGTLFLDEIGDISPRTQVALLRVLQECEIQRVGSTTPIRVDVRVICATHRNLEAMVQSGEFREDLYYRLKGIEVEVPPLRERIDDLGLLAGTFLNRLAVERGATPRTLSEAALALLRSHDWPGNVRELENVIRSVSLLCEGPVIDVQDFSDYAEVFRQAAGPQAGGVPPLARQAFERVASGATSLRALKREIEVECIRRALERCDGNITRAADLLGMKRPRLSQVIKELGIPLPAATGEAP
jgi:transcriptional regulator with GAF, ATPase, and Fis domain